MVSSVAFLLIRHYYTSMDTKGKYVFTGCVIKFVMHRGNPEHLENHELEYEYPEGPQENGAQIRSSHIAFILLRDFGLKMLSSVDNYFTFDISENIPMHHSVWYTCNVIDVKGHSFQVFIKIVNTHHIGSFILG